MPYSLLFSTFIVCPQPKPFRKPEQYWRSTFTFQQKLNNIPSQELSGSGAASSALHTCHSVIQAASRNPLTNTALRSYYKWAGSSPIHWYTDPQHHPQLKHLELSLALQIWSLLARHLQKNWLSKALGLCQAPLPVGGKSVVQGRFSSISMFQ